MKEAITPNHKKFVKIGTEDGEKLYAFKKWDRGVFGFLQNTSIEFKPGEIAINQQTLLIFHQGLGEMRNRPPLCCRFEHNLGPAVFAGIEML